MTEHEWEVEHDAIFDRLQDMADEGGKQARFDLRVALALDNPDVAALVELRQRAMAEGTPEDKGLPAPLEESVEEDARALLQHLHDCEDGRDHGFFHHTVFGGPRGDAALQLAFDRMWIIPAHSDKEVSTPLRMVVKTWCITDAGRAFREPLEGKEVILVRTAEEPTDA